ncbi:MAG TPA: GDSL-type esterase/lipase family protein [Luteitalea sp.]|nr:GDSL-type esterase/lipase family protein [Luteitalea sp.]
MLLRIALALLFCAGTAMPAFAQAASTWFLAEGASNGTFDEDILVGNPSTSAVRVTVTLLPAPDAVIAPGAVLERGFDLPATGRLTVNLRRDFPGLNGATSAQVSGSQGGTPADIVVERSMFFPLTGTPYAGGTGASGVGAPATRWILAEGSAGVFETFILIANPSPSAATVTARYLRGDGTSVSETVPVAPGNRATLWPSARTDLAGQGFSTVVESDAPVVAERAMYFDNFRSGHDAVGVPATGGSSGRSTWYFAEGFTGGNPQIAFETFLLIGNDNDQPAVVTATFFRDSGSPVTKTYHVQARSRFNIWTDQERTDDGASLLLPATAFSVRIDSTIPVVAERSVYWGTPSAADPTTPIFPWKEGHVVAGIEQPETRWAFAEGRQGEDGSGGRFDSFFLVVNPNPVDIEVRAIFATEDGTGVTATVTVPANTRRNIWPAPGLSPDFDLLQGRRFAAFLDTLGGQAFVAERAMYWNDYVGGHANAGTPWNGSFVVPGAKPADVRVTALSTTSGRLSGGGTVTIRGKNFSNTPVVTFGGVLATVNAIRTEAETGDRLIDVTVPARTVTTGFGAAGPEAVIVRDGSRFLRAPNFTRYFSVLAFGDSLTYGISNAYDIGGIRIPVQINRPYPRELKALLASNPQFGAYSFVTNAGWPGEWVTVAGFNGSPGGSVRSPRCTADQANCLYPQSPNPSDRLAPYDAVLFLEGINDLNNSVAPSTVRNRMRDMVVDAKGKGAQVLLELFSSYGRDQKTGEPATIPAAVSQYNSLLDALAVEQSVYREFYAGIDMCPDGLHPNQTGYDEMASIAYAKLRDIFRRCPPGVTNCQ